MNYTLHDLNCYIEAEKRKDVLPRDYFQTIAVKDFCDTPTEELMASIEVCMHVTEPYKATNVSSYQEFRRMFEEGMIDITQLTSRQRLLFLTCLSDLDCEQKMKIAVTKNEENFRKLRKLLPIVLPVLRDSSSYAPEQVKVAHNIAVWFMKCNQRVLNYRHYIEFTKYVLCKDVYS